MRVQCPPCGTRYSISERRIGADGRALSRCVDCGRWLVISRIQTAHVELRTADELVGQRSILALDYADWSEDISDRETMPIGVGASTVDLPSAYDARHADTDPGQLAELIDDEIGFDLAEAHEATDPGIGDTAGVSVGDSDVAPAAPTALESLSPVAPTAIARPDGDDSHGAPSTADPPTPGAQGPAEELPDSAWLVAAPKPGFFPEAELSADEMLKPKPELGALDMKLPDPRRRRRSRVEVQEMLTEFSVMFRLDTKARRRRTLATTAAVLLVCGAIVGFVAWQAGRSMPATADETRTLATSLTAAHSVAVDHIDPAAAMDGKSHKRSLSILATQLLQLHKVSAADRAATRAVKGNEPAPGPAPPEK